MKDRLFNAESTSRDNRIYRLDKNENSNAKHLIGRFFTTLNPEHLYEYPDMRAAYYNMSKLIDTHTSNILLTSGADDALRLLFQSFRNFKIGYATPTYGMVEVYADINNMQSITTPYYKSSENKFISNLSDIKNDVDVIYIANPDNPTGVTISINDIDELCESNCIVVVDEAYIDFTYRQTTIPLINKYDNLYVIRTLSKVYGAGAKVGCIVSSCNNIKELNKYRPAYEISNLGAVLLEAAFNEYQRNLNVTIPNKIIHNTLLCKSKMNIELQKLGLTIQPTSTNFILVHHEPWLEWALDKLAYYKILHIDKSDYIKLTVPNITILEEFIEDLKDEYEKNNEKN